MLTDTLAYEERYRWTRTSVTALTVCSALVLVAIAVPQIPLPLRVVVIAGCAYGAFLSVIVPASRKVALRVDASGLTLGGNPLRYKATTRAIPWHEVQRVFLWRRGPAGVRYLSVERPADAAPLSLGGTGKADRPAFYLARDPQVPAPTLKVGTTRGMQAFSIDDARLTDVIAHYAPSVSLVNFG